MPHFTFRETRTGKLKIVGADSALDAIKALTIYPWAFTLVDARPAGERTPQAGDPMHVDPADVAAVEAHSREAKERAYARAGEPLVETIDRVTDADGVTRRLSRPVRVF